MGEGEKCVSIFWFCGWDMFFEGVGSLIHFGDIFSNIFSDWFRGDGIYPQDSECFRNEKRVHFSASLHHAFRRKGTVDLSQFLS